MLPELSVPPSLARLLADLRPYFTAPSFTTFCALVCGMLAPTGRRTICGMLLGAGLSGSWSHDRAHTFFSAARWSAGHLGVLLARQVVRLLLPADTAVSVVIDDTLFKRTGKKVWAAAWFHDGSAKGPKQVGYGNNWVIAGIVVGLPMLARPVCLPVLARLVGNGTVSGCRLWLARQMVTALAEALPGRRVHVVANAAYAGAELKKLPGQVSWTTRLGKDAALDAPPPPRTGRRGRPRQKGRKLPKLADLARTATFASTPARRSGTGRTVSTATISCLWYSVFGPQPVSVVLGREADTSRGYHLALVTTDPQATAGQTVERYASRWAVERTVPFGLACLTLAVCWYATVGHQSDDVAAHRARRPWYHTKTNPSTSDMLTKLRRVLIAARFRLARPEQPTLAELRTIRLAWEDPAA